MSILSTMVFSSEYHKNRRLYEFGISNPIHTQVKESEGEECNIMATIRDQAKAYEPKTTKNITDLKEVSTELDIKTVEYTDNNGQKFTVNVIEVNKEQYRVPASVLKSLKALMSEKPGMTKFKVKKIGEGMKTTYTVIPLD